jgi:hypothetical protein
VRLIHLLASRYLQADIFGSDQAEPGQSNSFGWLTDRRRAIAADEHVLAAAVLLHRFPAGPLHGLSFPFRDMLRTYSVAAD